MDVTFSPERTTSPPSGLGRRTHLAGLTLEQIRESNHSADLDRQTSRLRAIVDAGEPVDLHAHSRHSDGDWSPPDLVADAAQLGLRLISLTDHDTVDGQRAAAQAADEHGLLFLNGMEV